MHQILERVKLEVVLLQESKLTEDKTDILLRWANALHLEIEHVPSEGASGGLVTLWKGTNLKLLRAAKSQRFLLTEFQLIPGNETCSVVNVYGPNEESLRYAFFTKLEVVVAVFPGSLIIGGDFDIILNDGERKGAGSDVRGNADFRVFVENLHLIDLPLQRGDFTWYNTRNGGLWSKLD